MRKIFLPLFIFISLGLLPAEEAAPRILILPLDNEIESSQYNVISNTVSDTLLLSLQLLGTYEVLSPEDSLKLLDLEEISAYAEAQAIDHVVFGDMSISEGGEILFLVELYDLAENRIKDTIETSASGIMEVFDASDMLIASLLGAFNAHHIGFGSLRVENLGYSDDFHVYLGNVFLGTNETGTSVLDREKILMGEYDLNIRQQRFGHNTLIHSQAITIEEYDSLNIEFEIPDLLEEEKADLNTIHSQLLELYDLKEDSNPSEEILSEVLTQLRALDGLGGIEEEYHRFKEREAYWQLRHEWWLMEKNSEEFRRQDLSAAPVIYHSQDPWVHDDLKTLALLNARLYSHIASLQASLLLDKGDLAGGVSLYDHILTVGRTFDSDTAFGFQGEYDQLREILDHPRRWEGWRKRKISILVESRAKLARQLYKENRLDVLLVLVEDDDLKVRINNWRRNYPYLNRMYKKDEVKVVTKEKGEKKETFYLPVFGSHTMILIPSEDPDYLSLLRPKRDFQRFHFYAGLGGGSWFGVRGQVRFAGGSLAMSLGAEFAASFVASEGKAALILPLQLDWYFLRRQTWELSLGFLSDSIFSEDFTYLFNSPGLSLGIVYNIGIFDIYLDNRIYIGGNSTLLNTDSGEPFILYAPQLGIRL